MKYLLFLLVPVLMCSCGVSQHGLRGYYVVSGADGKTRSVLAGAINADIPGAKHVKAGELEVDIDPTVSYTKNTYDTQGLLTATETRPGGVYVSDVTLAQGVADGGRITSGGNTALKALFGFARPG